LPGREGDRVGLIARDQAALKDVQRELQASGAKAVEWEAVDVSDAAAVFAAADQLERRLGFMDIWINDAMETVFSTVADIDPEEFRRVTEVTYLGFVYGTMAALRSMRPRRHGRIIQIGSALALSRHSLAGGLLRRQARDPRLHKFATGGVAP
jgi:NAD(P)-dependent dehydrogenase (short-subunit alcohol dehydrogenase family)